jgi:putative ABC transport system substrate-binding protein
LRQGLGEQGYVEGRNVEFSYRFAETQYDRLPGLAAKLMASQAGVVFAESEVATLAAKVATATIPIVFAIGGDPVELGLVSGLSRPNANITGVSYFANALVAKRLQLLHEIVPAAASIGYLVNPTNAAEVEARIKQAEIGARVLGVHLTILNASTPNEIERAFAILPEQGVGALLVDGDPMFGAHGNQLAALAARDGVPTIYQFRREVEAGGLMSYGASISDAWRIAGTYVGRILKGEKTADLPVQQSTRVELAINLKTAKTLGLTMPLTLRALADEVIE